MPRIRDYEADDEPEQLEETEGPAFQRLRKQTGKTVKNGDRLQASKEFGKRIHKFHKQRRRYEGGDKP